VCNPPTQGRTASKNCSDRPLRGLSGNEVALNEVREGDRQPHDEEVARVLAQMFAPKVDRSRVAGQRGGDDLHVLALTTADVAARRSENAPAGSRHRSRRREGSASHQKVRIDVDDALEMPASTGKTGDEGADAGPIRIHGLVVWRREWRNRPETSMFMGGEPVIRRLCHVAMISPDADVWLRWRSVCVPGTVRKWRCDCSLVVYPSPDNAGTSSAILATWFKDPDGNIFSIESDQ
jgi:hypothetical protein